MRYIGKKILPILCFAIVFFQIILISHRLSFDFDLLLNFYRKDYGLKHSLKINKKFKPVLEINQLIKKNNIKNFQLSRMLSDEILYAKIVEANYPSKLDFNSINYFTLNNEIMNNCNLIDNSEKINLYECRN